MAKSIHDDVLDQALNYVKNNGTRLCVCSTEPTTHTQALTTYMLAIKTIADTDYTGPSAGDISGRKIRVNAASSVSVTNSGDAQHVALVDFANSKLLAVTTCTLQTLTAGNLVNVPAWDIEIADPT